MNAFSRLFIVFLSLIFSIAFAAFVFSLVAKAQEFVDPPMIAQCTYVFDKTNAEQQLAGNVLVAIRHPSGYVTRVDYISKRDSTYTGFYFIPDSFTVDLSDGISVYGPCLINTVPVTVYKVRRLALPEPQDKGFPNGSQHNGLLRQKGKADDAIRKVALGT